MKETERRIDLSVIIPVYNARDYLESCVESIVESRIKNIEIILVDDGSIDESFCICQSIVRKNKHIRAFKKENGGSASARNYGLEKAKGSYITFVDSDDRVIPDEYRGAFYDTKAGDYDIGCFNLVVRGEKVGCKQADNMWERFILSPIYMHSLCNKFFKRSLIKGLNLDEDLIVCEDMLFCAKALLKANSICYLQQTAYIYQMVDGSVTNATPNIKKSDDDVQAANRLIDFYCEGKSDRGFQRFIAFRYQIAALRYLIEPNVYSIKKYRQLIYKKNAYRDLPILKHKVLCWCANNRIYIIPFIFITMKRIKYSLIMKSN